MKFKSLCSYVVMKTKHRSWRAACAAQSQLLQYQSVRFLIRYKKEFDHKAIFMSSRSTLGKDPPLGKIRPWKTVLENLIRNISLVHLSSRLV